MSKKRMSQLLLFVGIVVLLAIILVALVMIDGERIHRGAMRFLDNAIADMKAGEVPPISSDIRPEDERQIRSLTSSMPKGNFEADFDRSFGDAWFFYVHFESGESFYCTVDCTGTFMKLFAPVEYSLLRFERRTTKG